MKVLVDILDRETSLTKKQKTTTISTKPKVKRLSKVGEWLKSGQSIGGVYDMKAILK
jgi:hypothetical protein